ncbi:MAG: hypothetical protein ACTSRZ_17975 [Promethearchaeota archaeon]
MSFKNIKELEAEMFKGKINNIREINTLKHVLELIEELIANREHTQELKELKAKIEG